MNFDEAILKTLSYSDIFDYPLTLDELHRFLIASANKDELDSYLQKLDSVDEQEGYYFLSYHHSLSEKITKAIAFDKTGTLTKGEPAVTDIIPFGMSEKEVLRLAAICERGSEHPLARAVVKHAENQKLDVPEPKNFKAHSGLGVSAEADGKEILIGNERFMEGKGINISSYAKEVDRLSDEAMSHVPGVSDSAGLLHAGHL